MKLSELENWLEDLWNIIVDLHISINNAKFLLTDQSDEVNKIKKHGFFQHHTYQLKFIIVIQLSKLFEENNNQKRNIFKLFNRIKNERYDGNLNKLLKSNEGRFNSISSRHALIARIELLSTELEDYKDILDKIKVARDNLYAHKDPGKTISYIKWPDLESMVSFSAKFYNQINGGLHGTNTNFEWTGDWNVKDILESFARYRIMIRNQKKASP